MKKTYKGHTIEVNEHMRFVITAGPLLERSEETTSRYGNDTYQGVCEYIDRGLAAIEKEKRVKISLPVLTDMGETKKITGLNARTGHLTGVGDSGIYVYPDAPWIKAAIEQMQILKAKRDALFESLKPYQIKINYTYISAVRDYAESIEGLTKEYDTKAKKAMSVSTKTT